MYIEQDGPAMDVRVAIDERHDKTRRSTFINRSSVQALRDTLTKMLARMPKRKTRTP